MKDILKDIDTLALGNGFFIHWEKLYFFSPKELEDIRNECLGNLKKFCVDNNIKPNEVDKFICPKL